VPKRKKLSLKERIWNKISEFLIDFAESLPPVKRGLLSWLQKVRREPRLTRNAKPKGLNLDLECIWICEIVPIEQFEKQIASIIRLIQNHKTTRFLPGARQTKDIFQALKGLKEGVLGSSWHNIGLLDFEKVTKFKEVDYMTLEVESLSGGHVALYFFVTPKNSFKQRIANMVDSETMPHSVLFPPRKFRSIFKDRWGYKIISGESQKRADLQNLLFEFKMECSRYLNPYVNGLFFKANQIVPSVELWLKEDNSAVPQTANKAPFQTFWDSVGLSEFSWETYKEQSDTFSVTLPSGDFSDLSIKFVCDLKKVSLSSGYTNIQSQVENQVNDWIPALLSLWCVRSIYRDLLDDIGSHRVRLFSKINGIRTYKAFYWSGLLFGIEIQYKRLQKDFDLGTYSSVFSRAGFPAFIRTLPSKYVSNLQNDLVGNTKYFLKSLVEMVTATQNILKTKIDLQIISTNYWTQGLVIILTITMFILSLFAVITGTLSIATKPKICEAPRFTGFCKHVEKFLMEK
tara:strand:- start:6676 stop:8220 length:1545 start_codon:yes stop_codon:yes gene_type:complete